MKNKQGLSGVIMTVIMIALVLAAVVIVWMVARPMLQEGTEGASYTSKCLATTVEVQGASHIATGNYSVTLKRTAGSEEIAGVKVAIVDDVLGESKVKEFGSALDSLETKTLSIDTGDVTFIAGNKVEATPYFKDEQGKEYLCSTDVFEIVAA